MKLYDVIRKDQKEQADKSEPKKIVVLDAADSALTSESLERFTIKKIDPKEAQRIAWRKIAVIGGAIAFFAILYLIGIYFAHAKVVVNERQIPFSLLDTQIDLVNSTVADPSRLSFQTMIVTDSVTRQVFGSAMTTSTTKATGNAVIFNQYSKSSQTVRSATILNGANGKKYITQETVVVPGYIGTTKTAGSATVPIVAADIGPTYNSPGTTFTISGWGGTAAKSFFASSVGAVTGGQNGAMHTLSDADKQEASATLEADLREKLSRETRAQIPDNLVTFPDLQFITINNSSLNVTGTTIDFNASLTGSMVSYLIPRDLLAQTIASKAASDQAYAQVSIPTLGDLHVEPVTVIPTDPKNTPDIITVSLSGQGVVVPQVSAETIQQAVAGISASSFDTVISSMPEVDNAKFSLYPFWAPYFPYKQSRINVEIQ